MEVVENINDYYNEDTKVISMPPNDVHIHKEGFGYTIFHCMKENFGKTALIDILLQEAYSYDDLFINAVRTAIKMKSMGIKPGDIISICSHNQFDSVATFIAAFLIGAINATLEPNLTDADIEHLIKQVEPKMYFVSSDCETRIEGLNNTLKMDAKIVVYGDTDKNIKYSEFKCPQIGEENFEPTIVKDVEETCILLFSSGSTGLPKAMCYSHKFFGYHTGDTTPIPISLTSANIYWIGCVTALLCQIRKGSQFALTGKYDPYIIWDAIPKYNVTLLQLLPHIAIEWIKFKPKDKEVDLPYLAIVGYLMSKENILKLREAMPKTHVFSLYAMSETASLLNPACLKTYAKVTSAGIPMKGIQYKVVDPETEQNVGFNQRGELRVKSPYQMKGYYKRDSSDCWDEEGFFKTGDVVYYDEDFSFFVVDRIKEIFKSQGVHITPVKYENILEGHPDILMAIILGIPQPSCSSDDIMGVVVPRKGSSITPKDVEEYYNSKVIDPAKMRAGVRFMDSLPLSPSGKIARNRLKQMIINEIKV